MRSFIWTALVFATYAQAQSIVTFCESYSYTATSTFTAYETFYVVDGRGGVRPMTPIFPNTRGSIGTSTIGSLTTSNGVSNGGVGNSRTTSRSTTRVSVSENVPGNGTSVLIPDNTIAPTTPIPTSLNTISSSTSRSHTTSSTTSTAFSSTDSKTQGSTTSSTTISVSTITTIKSTSSSSVTDTSTSGSTTTITETSSSTDTNTTSESTVSTTTTPITTTTTSTLVSTSSTTSTDPIVTNQAYIDTILRHHNQHRLNHTSDPLTWNAVLAETAKKITDSCVYQHDTATDCTPGTSCYGQNIAAGYLPTQMSFLVSDGFYNSEVNSYTYYGAEPKDGTLHEWGHFSQIVWKIDTYSVGCYTMNCSERDDGLVFPGGAGQGIRPFFTVCNYGGPGNWVGEFKQNVIQPIGLPSIHAGYMCPTLDNCEDGETG